MTTLRYIKKYKQFSRCFNIKFDGRWLKALRYLMKTEIFEIILNNKLH